MTLSGIWAGARDITQVAVRPGVPGMYVSLGHETAAEALQYARHSQSITAEDETADDWQVQEAP